MKNSIIKKCLCWFFSFSFILLTAINSFALTVTDTAKLEKIINALQSAEFNKNELGLSDVNFEDFEISEAINTYNYTNEGFIKGNQFYPLTIQDELIAFAIEIRDGDDSVFQITTGLVSEIKPFISKNEDFALLYDDDSCYIYTNEKLSLLVKSEEKISNRLDLETAKDFEDFSRLELGNISNNRTLGYTNITLNTRVIRYYSCDVDVALRAPYENLCWAACIACLENYFDGETVGAEMVAMLYYGGTNFNRGLSPDKAAEVLRSYGYQYTYRAGNPGDGVITYNIRNGFPVYGSFITDTGNGHAMVIYGIDILGGYLSVMDPAQGFAGLSLNSQGNYVCTSPKTNRVYIFRAANCRYWQV